MDIFIYAKKDGEFAKASLFYTEAYSDTPRAIMIADGEYVAVLTATQTAPIFDVILAVNPVKPVLGEGWVAVTQDEYDTDAAEKASAAEAEAKASYDKMMLDQAAAIDAARDAEFNDFVSRMLSNGWKPPTVTTAKK